MMSTPVDHPSSISPLRQGLAAARANALPGLALIAAAVAILVAYHLLPPVTVVLDSLASWKLRYGFGYSIISTALFGGILPILLLQCRPTRRHRAALRHLPFFALFWATKGIEVDALYRLQAAMFGEGASLGIILPKVLIDQFVYVPLWAVPSTVVAYLWRDCGYSLHALRTRLGGRWYRRRVVPVLLSNWGVWVPTVAVIYCLELPLQLPVQNLILCLWALLVMFLTDEEMASGSLSGPDPAAEESKNADQPPGPHAASAGRAETAPRLDRAPADRGMMSPTSPRSSIG